MPAGSTHQFVYSDEEIRALGNKITITSGDNLPDTEVILKAVSGTAETGYVAEYRNADDLAAGIRYVLDEANTERLSQESLRKVREQYSEDVVASKYMELYSG